ncbi:MAG: DEAD/DEAH box helicase, partial [Gemmatimonadota bacterium]|nr:DEAD/DEAH box helicase [Gemmatimonadota bacterium]
LILDEAHHVRNPTAHRYQRISRLAREAAVLMLTATPVHNRRADLIALLSLFLGSRANDLTERELASCVVRRDCRTEGIAGLPSIKPVVSCEVPDDPDVVARLIDLPPPLPARDAGEAGSLINRGLVHQWASSEAALRSALRRRLARAGALISSLEAGRYPSAAELETWTLDDGTLQLGFAELLAPPAPDAAALLGSVVAHASALTTLLDHCRDASAIDEARAENLLRIRRECPGAKIVAFAQYSSTISGLYRRLVSRERVAMLTADGAQVAGGKLTRHEAIVRFAPRANGAQPPSRAEVIDLLLATDLLSEGVNLQDAEVVVHLDIPWTAARLEQRVGRVARMGSSHSHVSVYQIGPPASAESVLRGQSLLRGKWDLARTLVGVSAVRPFTHDALDPAIPSVASRVEQLRAMLTRWGRDGSTRAGFPSDSETRHIAAAAVRGGEVGFIAAGTLGNAPILLSCRGDRLSTDLDAELAACLLAEGEPVTASRADYDQACRSIRRWADRNDASESAGIGASPPSRRKRLLNRIDATLQNAPPHLRAIRAGVAAKARKVASAVHGVALEKELEKFTCSPLSDDDWLNALASLAVRPRDPRETDPPGFRLRALLLFVP